VKRVLPSKPCEQCGETFTPKEPRQKCCSRACGIKAYQNAWKDKSEANKKES